ncbi:MAG: DMT family transporter [Spirochaetaceae bacterium]
MQNNKIIPIMGIVLATAFFSTSGIWTKLSGQDLFVLAFFRSLIPIIFLMTLNKVKKNKKVLSYKGNKSLYIASFLNALRILLFFQGLLLTDISKAIIMVYIWPIFALIINIILRREKISLVKIFLMLVSFSGIIVIYLDNLKSENLIMSDLLGMSIMICSAFVYSITFVIFKSQGKDRNHYEITYFQNLVGVPIFFIAIIIKLFFNIGEDLVPMTLSGIGIASINGLIVGVFGFTLYFKGLKDLPASVASQLAYLEVIFAMFWGIILYQERPGITFLIGAGMIIFGALGRTFLKEKI